MPHHHHEHKQRDSANNLKIAFFLNLGFTIFEIIGGIYVNSVAIISDAIHDLGDSLSLGASWWLENKSNEKPTNNFPYGYRRFSLLGALINSIILIVGSIFIFYEAIHRILAPEPTYAPGMVVFALVGIAVNGYAAWKLSGGETLNEQVVSWHLFEDVLGWVAILIAAIILLFWDIPLLDPVLCLLITTYIFWNVISRLKEVLYIFLQGSPKNVDVEGLKAKLLGVDNVLAINNIHVWSLEGEHHVFTATFQISKHVTIENIPKIKTAIKEILEEYHIQYETIEIEYV